MSNTTPFTVYQNPRGAGGADGDVARLWNGFQAFEPACVLDHAPLVAMSNLVLLLTRARR